MVGDTRCRLSRERPGQGVSYTLTVRAVPCGDDGPGVPPCL